MKEKKLTSKQLKFIICFISLAVFAVAYLYIYTGYIQKTEAANNEIDTVKRSIEEREKKRSEEDAIRISAQETKEQIQDIIDDFPVKITKEDNFMFIEQMEEVLDIRISSIDVKDSTILYQTNVPVRNTKGAVAPNVETMAGTQAVVSMNFATSYQGFKALMEYIKNYPDKSAIDSVAVSYDNSTGDLTGSLVIKRYALTGTGKVYEPPYIDDINIGTDNIFGSNSEAMEDTEQP